MFDNIPPELELKIWRYYYSTEVIPYIKLNYIENITKRLYKSILPEVIILSVKEKAARIINSIISKEYTIDNNNIRTLDDMYYNLVNIHVCDMYDIFDL
jgi:hypothetical protein